MVRRMPDQRDGQALRDPEQVMSLSATAMPFDPAVLDARYDEGFVSALDTLGITLLVTREYEHLVVALSAERGSIETSCLRVPHPSGLVVDRERNAIHIACTRNPNQLIELRPSPGWLGRSDRFDGADPGECGLAPYRMRFLPGCMYLHDLAMVGGRLMANAVGLNVVVDLTDDTCDAVWWPRSVEHEGRPRSSRNLIQLNSIGAGASLADSAFTASCERFNGFEPGDPLWPVDRQGVLFDGLSREVSVRGLTRPHSARRGSDGQVWIDDSGYGTLNAVTGERADPVVALPGWTRGLCIVGRRAIVGTSRIIPRFEAYAPGVDPSAAICGLHIIDLTSGVCEGSLTWPAGDQIFAIDWIDSSVAKGFIGGKMSERSTIGAAWYKFRPPGDLIADTTAREG